VRRIFASSSNSLEYHDKITYYTPWCILKPAKAGAASFVVIQMFTNSKSWASLPKFVQIENAYHLLSVQTSSATRVPAMLEWTRENAH